MEARRPGPLGRLVWAGLGAAALAALAVAAGRERRAVAVDLGTARDLHGGEYAGSAACRSCHEDHYRTWSRTFHRTMTAEAGAGALAGDFSGATLRHAGVVARMDRDAAGAPRVTFTSGAGGGAPRAVTVARTVGSRRYQQYLTKVGDSYWRLPVAFHIAEQRWFPMTEAFLFAEPSQGSAPPAMSSGGQSPPTLDAIADDSASDGDPGRPVFGGGVFDRHVTRWNDNCVFCHNVAPDPGRDPDGGGFRTRVAELGVACEACHGPGAEHARLNADPVRRYTLHMGGGADPTIVNPASLSPARAADVCGRCHGQRIADDVAPFLARGDPFVPGDDLGLYTSPLWRDTPLGDDGDAFAARFWPDGTPRLTAYEYQGLLQSRCAQRGGLTCTSCHGMHEGDPRGQIRAAFAGAGAAGGNSEGGNSDGMCTGCHARLAAPAVKASHSGHDAAGAGARCVACHMPRIVYGVLDIHRSHRIEVPHRTHAATQGQQAKQGQQGQQAKRDRPDACGGCHVDVDAVFAGDPVSRAVAVDALGRLEAPADAAARARRLGALLVVMADDRYPAVRHLAWRAARRLGAGAGAAARAAVYDPSAPPAERQAAVAALRAALGARALAPDAARVAALRVSSRTEDVEIGE